MAQQVIQIAGFSNSGKTTLVEKLVRKLTDEGFRVGTIKHHGHGGELTSLDQGKDSWKHRQAGSIVSGAVSKGALQLNVNRDEGWTAEELIKLYENFPLDTIIVEGFKTSSFPKVVLIKDMEDVVLLSKLENIFCVISWISFPEQLDNPSLNYFKMEEETKYLDFIVQKMRG